MHHHLLHLSLLSQLLTTVLSGCPQSCNARGNCNTNNQCECFNGFRGAACGEFTCPSGVPWFEAAEIIDVAHRPLTATECSTMGTCNRLNGKCGCYDGFEGIACETMMCPNNCNRYRFIKFFFFFLAIDTVTIFDIYLFDTYIWTYC